MRFLCSFFIESLQNAVCIRLPAHLNVTSPLQVFNGAGTLQDIEQGQGHQQTPRVGPGLSLLITEIPGFRVQVAQSHSQD